MFFTPSHAVRFTLFFITLAGQLNATLKAPSCVFPLQKLFSVPMKLLSVPRISSSLCVPASPSVCQWSFRVCLVLEEAPHCACHLSPPAGAPQCANGAPECALYLQKFRIACATCRSSSVCQWSSRVCLVLADAPHCEWHSQELLGNGAAECA
jgi:hypothetical protein